MFLCWLLNTLYKGEGSRNGRYRIAALTPFERLRCRRDSYQNSGLLALGVVERVLGRSVCGRGRDDVELTSHPLGLGVRLHLGLGVLDTVEGLLLACGLDRSVAVLGLPVSAVRSEVVTYLFGLIRCLFSRLIPGSYSPTSLKMAVMLIGSPVATMLMVAVVWPLLHFTN